MDAFHMEKAHTIESELILLNDFSCRETRLHNADWLNRMIALGSIQRYAVYIRTEQYILAITKICQVTRLTRES